MIMRITHLELQNIGPFERQIFDFNPVKTDDKAEIHIFSCVNGAGKSTVIRGTQYLFLDKKSPIGN